MLGVGRVPLVHHRARERHQVEALPGLDRAEHDIALAPTERRGVRPEARHVQPPEHRRARVLYHVTVDRALRKLEPDQRVVVRDRELAQHAHPVGVRPLAVPARHLAHIVVAHPGRVEAGDVQVLPLAREAVEGVVEIPLRPGGVAEQERGRVVARHRATRRLEDRLGYAGGLVHHQQHPLGVDALQGVRLLGAAGAGRDERLLGARAQLDAVGLDLEEIRHGGRQELGPAAALAEEGVEELAGRGGRDHDLDRHAGEHEPEHGPGGHGRLAGAVAGADRDLALSGRQKAQEVTLPRVWGDA